MAVVVVAAAAAIRTCVVAEAARVVAVHGICGVPLAVAVEAKLVALAAAVSAASRSAADAAESVVAGAAVPEATACSNATGAVTRTWLLAAPESEGTATDSGVGSSFGVWLGSRLWANGDSASFGAADGNGASGTPNCCPCDARTEPVGVPGCCCGGGLFCAYQLLHSSDRFLETVTGSWSVHPSAVRSSYEADKISCEKELVEVVRPEKRFLIPEMASDSEERCVS